MLLAGCRYPLLSCAKGHVARLSTGTRFTNVPEPKRSPAVWRRNILLPSSTDALKTPISKCSCPDHRQRCLDLVRQVVNPTLPKSLQWVHNQSAPSIRKLHSCTSRILPLTHLLSTWINAGFQSSPKGYCTTHGNPGYKDESNVPKPQTNSRASDASPSNQRQFKELYENPWTIPNFLCMARILLSPVLGYLIMEQYFQLSLGLFALAGATDMLDGYIARNWPNQKSALGSALDPLADKILISVLYISLTYAQLIPVPLTALVISRDIVLIAAVFYVRYKTVPPPVTLSKFFNPCYTTAQLKPTLISKFNTAIQLILVAASLASPIFHYTDSVLLQSLWYVTALTTAASGYSYYHYGRKTVEVLNNRK